MSKKTILICVFVLISGLAIGEEAPLPFSMPIPDGWRTETIPFPLEFAPDLPYTGLEELRFAPGMFQEDSEEFWTYAFVWWVGLEDPNDPSSLSTHLEAYFRGLMASVAKSRQISVEGATFRAAIEAGDDTTLSGAAETFDAFVTSGQIQLHVHGQIFSCPAQKHQAIFFAFSPQARDHQVWSQLEVIRQGFRCSAPGS